MNDKIALIKSICLNSDTTDPIAIALRIMAEDSISIHGPEHHILDGACFLAALYNAGVEFALERALEEMILRGGKMPGATCGQWGVCGSAASVGAALAIVHGTGPLSSNSYYSDNLELASRALHAIAQVGGPRCCKRNAFLSLGTAVDFVKERYGLELEKHEVSCTFSSKNKQCLGENCPYCGR